MVVTVSGPQCRDTGAGGIRERRGKKGEHTEQLRRKRSKLEMEKVAGRAVGVVRYLSAWQSQD